MKAYERSLRAQVREATDHLDDKAESRYNDITSDDYAQAMKPFIKRAQTIRDFQCPEADKMAYDFLLHLADNSCCDLDTLKGCGYGERTPFDKAVDSALIDVAKARKAAEGTSFFLEIKQSVGKMRARSKYLSGYGIHSWFPETISLFTRWVNDEDSEDDDRTDEEDYTDPEIIEIVDSDEEQT